MCTEYMYAYMFCRPSRLPCVDDLGSIEKEQRTQDKNGVTERRIERHRLEQTDDMCGANDLVAPVLLLVLSLITWPDRIRNKHLFAQTHDLPCSLVFLPVFLPAFLLPLFLPFHPLAPAPLSPPSN